ncbi:Uncharacterised protein [Legionella cincinnatiensis]|uniref:Uncharacterized protein n=1 Tax=Legionella cincinnatiensis TaxID=28085 RepID=A0A378IMA8_9GAMM|nr:Uncharacterised protein [Legionella cincinnatiensis]
MNVYYNPRLTRPGYDLGSIETYYSHSLLPRLFH